MLSPAPPLLSSQVSALRSPRKSSAFTLIELLVVIAIIVILAGLAFPAVQSALQSGKKAQARNDLHQMVMAVKAYQLEYGKLPTVANTSEFGQDNNNRLLTVLRGVAESGEDKDVYNPRMIAFIEPRIANTTKGGIGPDGKFYDPWGTPYKIRLDSDYNNQIENFYTTGAGWGTLNYSVITVSAGPDKQFGSGNKNDGVAKDDIVSWQ